VHGTLKPECWAGPMVARTKRAAEGEADAAPAKKARDRLLDGVLDGLKQAQNLPDSCRAMLAAAAPSCLRTPPAERHEAQALFVRFIGEAIDSVCVALEDSLNAIKVSIAKMAEGRGGLVAQVEHAKAAVQTQDADITRREEAMSAAGAQVESARSALVEAKRLQTEGDAKLVEVGKDKQELEAAMKNVKLLQEEEGFVASQVAERVNILVPIAKRLGLDDSLVIALPTASGRHPSKRGPLDHMVLEQLQNGLVSEVAKLSSELEAGSPAMQERADVVAAGQSRLDALQKERQAIVNALVAAQEQGQVCAGALASVETALSLFDTNWDAPGKALKEEQAATALQNFQGYNVECFNMLRDLGPAAEG